MRILTMGLFLLACSPQTFAAAETTPLTELEGIQLQAQQAIDLARTGAYGPLSGRQIKLINAAGKTIRAIADRNEQVSDLSESDRAQLHRARLRIEQVLRIDNKNRIVCTRSSHTGTRLVKSECLTVGQREERARKARYETEKLQRITCVPGQRATCDFN
jgi:hypothetical protein